MLQAVSSPASVDIPAPTKRSTFLRLLSFVWTSQNSLPPPAIDENADLIAAEIEYDNDQIMYDQIYKTINTTIGNGFAGATFILPQPLLSSNPVKKHLCLDGCDILDTSTKPEILCESILYDGDLYWDLTWMLLFPGDFNTDSQDQDVPAMGPIFEQHVWA